MNHNTNPIIVGLDIGTTKIAAIAGRKNEYGKLRYLALAKPALIMLCNTDRY